MTGQAGDTEARWALLDLIAKWHEDQTTYPLTNEGKWAAAAVRLCAQELADAIAAALPSGTTEPPAPGGEGLRGEVERLRGRVARLQRDYDNCADERHDLRAALAADRTPPAGDGCDR